jgi:hypothetical protein
MKNYIGFVNDHSGSMASLARAAIQDYNANITAFKDAASREMLDTVVSVVGVGLGGTHGVQRQVVISNPHVLKPVTDWPCPGGTPLYDGIGHMIELFESLPDYNDPNVSFLVMVTTDGEEMHSVTKYKDKNYLRGRILTLQQTGRWTFVMRVPRGYTRNVQDLGIPAGNIVEWETSSAGMAAATAQTTAAVSNYYAARTAGAKSSNVFYANAQSVNTQALKELDPKEFSLYVVPNDQMGILISDFILGKRMNYLKGAAFYQLTKTEPRVQPTKLILVRDRTTGKVYAGNEARDMIGLPRHSNARLHPGDHGNFDIFIQSESWNRKLVAGTGVVYWEKQGVPFTQAEVEKFTKPAAPATPAVVQLPAVAPTNRPTPNPASVTAQKTSTTYNLPTIQGKPVKFFDTREQARQYARATGKQLQDAYKLYNKSQVAPDERWFVYE